MLCFPISMKYLSLLLICCLSCPGIQARPRISPDFVVKDTYLSRPTAGRLCVASVVAAISQIEAMHKPLHWGHFKRFWSHNGPFWPHLKGVWTYFDILWPILMWFKLISHPHTTLFQFNLQINIFFSTTQSRHYQDEHTTWIVFGEMDVFRVQSNTHSRGGSIPGSYASPRDLHGREQD